MTALFGILILSTILSVSCGKNDSTYSSASERIAREQGHTVVFIRVVTESGERIGSGIIVDPAGHILTNHHVIEGIQEGWARVVGGKWMSITGILSQDEEKDLAIVGVNRTGQMLSAAIIGSAKDLSQGENVIAIGSPLGEENSISNGIVSAIRTDAGYTIIQNTAAISSGNSGGALFNEQGEVVGVVSFTKLANGENDVAQGLNYAVAIDEALPLMGQDTPVSTVTPGLNPPMFEASNQREGVSLMRIVLFLVLSSFTYVISTFVVFPALIGNIRRHPSSAFGIAASITWGGIAVIFAVVFSGFFDYLVGWSNSYTTWLLWSPVCVGVIAIICISVIAKSGMKQGRE